MEGSPTNGKQDSDFIPELGALGPEITALMNAPPQPQKKAKSKIRAAKKKQDDWELLELQLEGSKALQKLRLDNYLYSKYIRKLHKKKTQKGRRKKRARKEGEEATPKQLEQRSKFKAKVDRAKELYYAQKERSSQGWQAAMQRATSEFKGLKDPLPPSSEPMVVQ